MTRRWTALAPVFGWLLFGATAFGQTDDPFGPAPDSLFAPAASKNAAPKPRAETKPTSGARFERTARDEAPAQTEPGTADPIVLTAGPAEPASDSSGLRTSLPDPFGPPTSEEQAVVEPLATVEPSMSGEPLASGGSFPVASPVTFSAEDFLLFLCAALVLFLQAGFAMLEAGFNSSKHTVNNLFKSVLNLAAGAVLYFLVGYHLMYPVEPAKENYLGQLAPGIDASLTTSGTPGAAALAAGPDRQTTFLFQAALAVTAATILSGAVAGRMRFGASLVYGTAVTAFVYPMIGYWTWGGGWLSDLGFYDLAGSGVVHMTGGFAGLAGAILLGPRIGRYTADGRPIAIPGHSLPLASLGVFVLLTGWYGLNAGGLVRGGAIDPAAVGLIAVNTTLAAAAGCCLATGLSWVLFGKPDLSMALSGLLGGLVGISAGCNGVTNLEAIAVGGVSGGLVVLAIILLDKLRVDDPVGAFPVHGVCGAWGLVACTLFGDAAYWGNTPSGVAFGNAAAQFTGLAVIAGFSFACMLGLFGMLKSAGFLRVSPDEEDRGLDISEHGMSAYAA